MNFFKKLIFILSLSAIQLSVKIEAQNADCGGTYTNLPGAISSPNYPSNYSNNLNCYYYIQIAPPNYVSFTFMSFETQSSSDWLQVSCSSDSTIRAQRFSGSVLPSPLLIPPCSNVSLQFHTDDSMVFQGFRLIYNIYNECGGTFMNLSGTISSPNYPSDYDNNLNCSYYIQISPPNTVGISFISFATESTYDWLEVSCSSDSAVHAQRFSGLDLPSYLSIPTCSSVLLLFHTDGSMVHQGFRLRYIVGGGCGGTYSNLTGTISSPNYPSNYDNNLNCSYSIQISPPNSVNITFISFATESNYDWLQVICPGNSAIPAQKFDGNHLPPFLSISSCSRVQLLFHTDGSTVAKGFSLRYNIGNGLQGGLTMEPSNVSVRSDTTEPIVLSCSSRAIQSDVYPWWSFSTDGTLFRIITAPDCSVFSSVPNSNRLYYSTARQDSTGTCNLTISPFYVISAVGFYTCTDATLDYASARVTSYIACGGTFSNLSGIISSPNYPFEYNNYLNCSYYIQISPPNSVGISFISFAMEACCDWLEVSCSSDSSILPQRFSGTDLPSSLSIPMCSSVSLLFHTDSTVVRQGFSLRYTVGRSYGCGGTYSNLTGTISSPNYPSNYANNLNCSYNIQISPPNSVNITFISFATESNYDWLQVICPGNSAIPAQKFDGNHLPPSLSIRSCSRVQLLFRTDGSTTAKGFSLRYNIGNGLQGGLTMEPSNASVRSDTTEPIVLSCSSRAIQPDVYPWWSFSTDGTLFRIITGPDCSVYSSLPNSSPLYYSTAKQDSTGTCNLTILPYYLTSAVGYYTCTDATLDSASARVTSYIACGETFTNLSGTISSPDYPSNYDNNLNCSYYIQMSPPNSVGIAFISFATESTYDWLEVSCSSDSSILAQRFSGLDLPSYLSIPPCSSVLLLFHTDGSATYQGFSLRYTIGGGCGVTYSNISGTISSPNYPSNYDNNLNCSYYIQISPPNAVNITFISFATESNYDWLQVSCPGNSAIPAQRFDGSDLPPFLSIRSCSKVRLLFRTDGSTVAQGFSLRYNIGNGLQGGLTIKPSNLYFRTDTTEPIVLSCSSRAIQPDVLYPWWSFSTDGTSFRIITAPDCSVFTSLPLYYSTARQDPTGTCNLTISPSYVTSAVGFYTCTDATLDYASALVASLIDPSLTVTDLSYPGTEFVRGDQISITCSVRVLQTTSRSRQFTPSVYIYSDDNQRPIAASNSTASIIVLASPEVLPSYVCNINFTVPYNYFPSKYATNLPQNISMMIPSRPVLYWPEDKTMLIQGHDDGRVVANGNLRCSVPSNPPATYQWTDEATNRLFKGPTVTVSNNGTYTCTANNNIRGVMYEVSKSINVTIITPPVIDIQQTSPYAEKNQLNVTALVIGVVLGVAVLLIVLAIVTYFYLRKKKKSAGGINYYDMDAVIKTDGCHHNNSYDNMTILDGLPSDRGAVEA